MFVLVIVGDPKLCNQTELFMLLVISFNAATNSCFQCSNLLENY